MLVEGWCQQFPGHSIGTLAFGPDGALYAGGGEGASFQFADYGQTGDPPNPCGDPPGGVGATLTPPSAQGGSLRAQDLRTAGDPVGLSGSIIRLGFSSRSRVVTPTEARIATSFAFSRSDFIRRATTDTG